MLLIREKLRPKTLLYLAFITGISLFSQRIGSSPIRFSDVSLFFLMIPLCFTFLNEKGNNQTQTWDPFFIPFFFFTAGITTSLFFSLEKDYLDIKNAVGSIARYCFCFLLFFLTKKYFRTTFSKKYLSLGIFYFIVSHSILLLISSFLLNYTDYSIGNIHPTHFRVSGIFKEPAHMAIFFTFCHLTLSSHKQVDNIDKKIFLSLILICSSVYVSKTIGGGVLAILITALYLFETLYKKSLPLPNHKVLLTSALIIFLFLLSEAGIPRKSAPNTSRFNKILKLSDNSFSDRTLGSYYASELAFRSSSALGIGFGSITNFIKRNIELIPHKKKNNFDIHMTPLIIGTMLGILGLIGYLIYNYLAFKCLPLICFGTLLAIDLYHGGFLVPTFWFFKAIILDRRLLCEKDKSIFL